MDRVGPDDLIRVQKLAREVDEQLADVVVMPVPTLERAPEYRGSR